MVLADSRKIPRAPRYSGTKPSPCCNQPSTRLSRPTVSHPKLFKSTATKTQTRGNRLEGRPHNTAHATLAEYSHTHGLAIIRFRSPLLTEYLFLWVLRCFTSPRSSHTGYLTHQQVTPHYRCWVPPFRNPRINTRSSTPRGISQTATSFISS